MPGDEEGAGSRKKEKQKEYSSIDKKGLLYKLSDQEAPVTQC